MPQEEKPSSLVSIDTSSGQIGQLSDLGGRDAGIWSPVEHKGWAIYDWNGCDSIAPINDRGVKAMPPIEPASLLPWILDADFSSPQDCTARGMIGYPQAEPTMSRVIVLASPEAAGVVPGDDGRNRKAVPWHLYELDLSARRVRKVGGNFVQPAGVSVGAAKAVVVGSRDGTAGIYTVDLQNGTTTLVGKGTFGPPGLSPDGRSVVLAEYPPGAASQMVVRPVP